MVAPVFKPGITERAHLLRQAPAQSNRLVSQTCFSALDAATIAGLESGATQPCRM